MFIPHQNEFIFIWLYFGFAVFFWIQVVLLINHDDAFGYKTEEYYTYMLVATLAVALSVTVTLLYLIFYSMSKNTERTLDYIDWDFKIFAYYALAWVFIKAEMSLYPIRFGDTITLMDAFMILTVAFFIITLILA